MTVQAQDSVQYYDGPINVGAVIPITDFTFIDNSHVSMKIRNVDGIWEYGVDYTVDGAGTLERTATILKEVEAGQTLAVYLDVPITQNISPEEGGNFPASTNEFVLDKLTYICQMLYERVARSMQVSIDNPFDGTLSVLVPGKAIKINAAGNGLELSDLDPDQAVVEIQRYIRIAEAAAEAAEQSKDTAQEIVDGLNVTKEQVDEAAAAAIAKSEAAIERVDQAEKHRLNSKEIATILTSSVPQSNTDLHLADGSVITSEDSCWAEFHNRFMKKKRALTDVKTKYYRYDSYNYSRIWYSKTKSEPTRFYTRTEQAFEGPIPAVEFDYQLEGPILRDVTQNVPGLLLTDAIDLVVTLIAPDTSETVLTRGTDFTITGSLTEAKATITFLRNIEQDYTVDIHTNEYAGAIKPLTDLTFSNINNVIVNEVDSEGNVTQLVVNEDYEISGQGSDGTAEVVIIKPIVQGHSFVVVDKGLDDVLYVPAGDIYIRNRHDDYILRSSMSIRSYYKLKQLSHVGHEAPEYLLWEVKPGDAQKAEPSTEDANDFYVYSNDERIGTSCLESSRNAARFSGNSAGYGTITNIVVLPPDITSPYRRIQITAVDGASTYYYYYDVIPVELHAYVNGSVADLNLSSVAGVQTEQTVICPYLIPTQNGYNEKITNADFLTTEEWMAAKASGNDYREFYSADSSLDKTFEIENLHDEVEIVGGNYLTNRAGVFSGFSISDYLQIPRSLPKTLNHDGSYNKHISQFDFALVIKTPSVNIMTNNGCNIVSGTTVDAGSVTISYTGLTQSTYGNSVLLCSLGSTSAAANRYDLIGSTLTLDTYYKIQFKYDETETKLKLYINECDSQGQIEGVSTLVTELTVDPSLVDTYFWTTNEVIPFSLGHGLGWSGSYGFDGEILLPYCSIKINNELWWGNKVVPYAKDSKENFIREYAYNKQPEYQNEIASNVYETNPSGYAVVGNAPDVDGWWTNAATNQGCWLGAGSNSKFILHRNDDYIHITGRFITGRLFTAYQTMFQVMKEGYGVSPFRLDHNANSQTVQIAMGHAGNNWGLAEQLTSLSVKPATEYFVDYYCDFTKKYNAQHEEDQAGTLYKYILRLKEWTGPEDAAEFEEWVLYTTYRLGQAANDTYAIGGGGWDNYTLDVAGYMNQYSVEVNGRHLFTDNIHVVDRNANATALPKISPNDEEESYVVVANGITEDVVLATPQEQIDEYTEDEILPQIADAKIEAIRRITELATNTINQINNAYAGQLSNMTQSYNDKMAAITDNYDDSMEGITSNYNTSMTNITANYRESMRVITNTQCVLIDSYVNGTSWYRVYSDGWCEQGGVPLTANTSSWASKTTSLLLPYKNTNYIFKINGNWSDASCSSAVITAKTTTNITYTIAVNTAAQRGWWEANGYIDLTTFQSLNS